MRRSEKLASDAGILAENLAKAVGPARELRENLRAAAILQGTLGNVASSAPAPPPPLTFGSSGSGGGGGGGGGSFGQVLSQLQTLGATLGAISSNLSGAPAAGRMALRMAGR